MITQLAQNGLTSVDVIMAGNVSAEDLAAVSLGCAIWTPIFLFIVGCLIVLSALVAHAHGSGKPEQAVFLTHQGAWLGLGLGLGGWWICQQGTWLLQNFDVEPVVRDKAIAYLSAISWSTPAIGLYQSLRSFCEGATLTKPIMLLTLAGFLLNIPVDYALVFGWGIIPAMGSEGCGWATSLVCWSVLLMSWLYTRYAGTHNQQPNLYRAWINPDPGELGRLLAIGLPVALAIFFEISLFSIISLLVAQFGTIALAGHQIAYSITSNIYMIPLALGMAISIRTGWLLGQGLHHEARFSAYTGITIAVSAALLSGTLLLTLSHGVTSFYSVNEDVVTLATRLLILAVIFQIPDAIQVATSGALRGYRDTKAIMFATLLAYWLIGLPLGILLAHGLGNFEGLGVSGYWAGLIAGLTAAAILLLWRFNNTATRHH